MHQALPPQRGLPPPADPTRLHTRGHTWGCPAAPALTRSGRRTRPCRGDSLLECAGASSGVLLDALLAHPVDVQGVVPHSVVLLVVVRLVPVSVLTGVPPASLLASPGGELDV